MNDALEWTDEEVFLLVSEVAGTGAGLRLEVRGWSMYPLIRDRDVLEIIPVPLSEVHIGETVFYRSGTRLLAHRVIGSGVGPTGPYLRARGDSFRQEDPKLTAPDLVGRVKTVYRSGRRGVQRIPQDRGFAKWAGILIARSSLVHRVARRLSLLLRQAARLFGRA